MKQNRDNEENNKKSIQQAGEAPAKRIINEMKVLAKEIRIRYIAQHQEEIKMENNVTLKRPQGNIYERRSDL